MTRLLDKTPVVINVGLPSFAESVAAAGGKAVHLEWRPPAEGDAAAGRALALLAGDERVAAANETAFAQFRDARPVLRAVAPAREVVPGLADRMLLHAGPPIAWERMCGPMQGAVIGAALFEGWATEAEEARELASSGEIAFGPCHDHETVGPMAGVVSPSMPVWVVQDAETGARGFSNLNEGLGKALRFGAYSEDVIARLRWMAEELGPVLAAAAAEIGGLELKPLVAQALHMGDEGHNRNVAATSLLFRRLAPAMLRAGVAVERAERVMSFLGENDHFFLNLSMASSKVMADAARGVEASSMVTAMTRNGVEFGVRLSGTGDRWFLAPSPLIDGLFFSGYSSADANPDLGDSSIAETVGIGGFAMAAAPAIVQFVGGTPADALAYTRQMYEITLGTNPAFTLPPLSFGSTPAGIDALRVVDTGIAPIINTGIAHKDAGVGQVGAGVTRAPLRCFVQAVVALAEDLLGAAPSVDEEHVSAATPEPEEAGE